MTVSTTPRLGQTRWSADADPQNRTQFDTDAANREALTALYFQGTLASRPAASAANQGAFHWATDPTIHPTARLAYSNGTVWTVVAQPQPIFPRLMNTSL